MTDALTRRRLLTLVGVSAGSVVLLPGLAYAGTPTDEQEVGPFYVDEGLVRSDIVGGEAGTPLTFSVTVTDSHTDQPLVGAAVDIWHANAGGVYSDESSESTSGETWLRGIQITDSAGKVTFTTVYPGWYSGRTVHIHAKVRTGGTVSGTSYSGGTTDWIGQFFFPEATTAAVAATSPYSSSTTARTTNCTDRVYTQQNGTETLLTVGGSSSAYTAAGAISVAAGGGSSTTTPCVISGASKRTTTHGTTVPIAAPLLPARPSRCSSARTAPAATPSGAR